MSNGRAWSPPFWPLTFITVACGAISGFHATQSPIMSRCLKDERLGRPVFYGAMVAEGIIALIWAAGMTFYDGTAGLAASLAKGGPGGAVYDICVGFLGTGVGATLAMLGVIACPITSGDTAFRSARLTLADWFGIPQKEWGKRLAFAIPLLAVGGALSQINFNIVWRYFSWTNQTLAMIVLWTGAIYLYRKMDNKMISLIAAVPATFSRRSPPRISCRREKDSGSPPSVSCPAGVVFAAVFLLLYLKSTFWRKSQD